MTRVAGSLAIAVLIAAAITGCGGSGTAAPSWTYGETIAPSSGEPSPSAVPAASTPVGSGAPVASAGPDTSSAPQPSTAP